MGGFAEADITVLKNPLRQEMEDAIYRLFAHRQKDDLLLFYFSGHGVKDESGKLYLSTRVTRKDKGRLVKPSAVAASFLHESINESKSQRQVLILDCCFSGAIAQGLTVKDDGSVNVQEQLGGKGRAILTASTSTQYSFEQEGAELSIYTCYLVEGIEKGAADLDGDGWIGLDELHEYASSKVQEAAPAMTPKFYPVEEGYRIRLAKAPVDDPKLKYRKEVEGIAREHEGEISSINRSYLDELRNTLKLVSEDADAIESEVLEPYRQRKAKLQRYEQVFTEAIGQQYPLSERDRKGLKRLQQAFKLRDEDVLRIERKIIRQRRRFSTAQLLTRQRFLKLAGFGGAGLVVTVVVRALQSNSPQPISSPSPLESLDISPQPISSPSPLKSLDISPQPVSSPSLSRKATPKKFSLKVFNFDVVTVDARGKEAKSNRKQAKFFTEYLGNRVSLEMVSIPGGTFLMGSPKSEPERTEHEEPQHTVTIQPFFIGKFPVTQAQWQAVASLPKIDIDLNPYPSYFKGPNRPVEQVSWYESVEFCARLSRETGREYRLPSEAEWEYACRAGTPTPFHFGETISPDLANYNGNSTYAFGSKGIARKQTTEVGSFSANAFGLYDMHGNVWEWCADHWHDSYEGAPTNGSIWVSENENDHRPRRGGSWLADSSSCRSAFRDDVVPDSRRDYLGFRVVCVRA
jgi:formylglycine-generating enzyme required for sulfatase activity/uncharacterized caspase-like protein